MGTRLVLHYSVTLYEGTSDFLVRVKLAPGLRVIAADSVVVFSGAQVSTSHM